MSQETQTLDIGAVLLQERPEVDEIYVLRREAYSERKVREELENVLADINKQVARDEDSVKVMQLGIGLWIFNRCDEADEILSRVRNRKGATYFYARNLLDLHRVEEAAEYLESAYSKDHDSFFIAILLVEARRRMGDVEGAMKLLATLEAGYLDRAEFHYEKAYCLEAQGLYEEALDEYEKSAVLDPDSHKALFRMAYLYDLHGNDEKAMDVYERLIKLNPVHISELINLGLLYEDNREYEKAMECYNRVLQIVPNHRRATMYYEDASASVTMFYDEDKAKLIEKRNTILNTPVTDFELSVRSRNCLVNMNINTLGDLVQKTETELLSYKNFGETSLIEIKEILRQKGLRLGMGRTDLEPTSPDFEKIWSGVGTETRDNMQKPLSQFELSVRSRRCLESMNVHTVGDLLDKTEGELMAVKNFGQTSLKELKELLGGLGLEIKKA